MISIDAIWLATEPMDMRAGTETALARVIAVFGAAKPHYAYLFANRRANRISGYYACSWFEAVRTATSRGMKRRSIGKRDIQLRHARPF